jgi:predicted nucleotidyltransferase
MLPGIKNYSKKISSFLEKEGSTRIAVFGSYAREGEKPENSLSR